MGSFAERYHRVGIPVIDDILCPVHLDSQSSSSKMVHWFGVDCVLRDLPRYQI
jgi:hypothetical protein